MPVAITIICAWEVIGHTGDQTSDLMFSNPVCK